MHQHTFLTLGSRKEKVKTVIVSMSILALIVIAGLFITLYWYAISKNIPIVQAFMEEIAALSVQGVFYAAFFGELFFIPLPIEPFYYLGLLRGDSVLLSFILVNIGVTLAQWANYWMGSKLSSAALHLFSKKKMYAMRRKVNRYGGYAIFFFNVLPAPSPVLTFVLGVANYNLKRLMILTVLGTFIKFAVVTAFFLLVHG